MPDRLLTAALAGSAAASAAAAGPTETALAVPDPPPWHWVVHTDSLELYADAGGRLSLVRGGGAVHHVKVALAADGLAADVVAAARAGRRPRPPRPGHGRRPGRRHRRGDRPGSRRPSPAPTSPTGCRPTRRSTISSVRSPTSRAYRSARARRPNPTAGPACCTARRTPRGPGCGPARPSRPWCSRPTGTASPWRPTRPTGDPDARPCSVDVAQPYLTLHVVARTLGRTGPAADAAVRYTWTMEYGRARAGPHDAAARDHRTARRGRPAAAVRARDRAPARGRPGVLADALALADELHRDDRRTREPYVNHLLRSAIRVLAYYRVTMWTSSRRRCCTTPSRTTRPSSSGSSPTGAEPDRRDRCSGAGCAGRTGSTRGWPPSSARSRTRPREPGVDRHEQYRSHVAESLAAHPWARVIKASDFTDNGVGLIYTTAERQAPLANKYRPLVPVLRELIARADTPLDDDVKAAHPGAARPGPGPVRRHSQLTIFARSGQTACDSDDSYDDPRSAELDVEAFEPLAEAFDAIECCGGELMK